MSVSQTTRHSFSWVWLIPTALIALALLARAAPLVAAGIGLAAALSLSGSI
ncbi:MAG TPA: hypothetical protein VF546_15330 [Pyrinomonadaceae bacterium]|jgi:hypothetical protein